MAKRVRGQAGRVGNYGDGAVQSSGQRVVGSHARSTTAGKQGSGQEKTARSGHNPGQQLTYTQVHRIQDTR
ncbi:unnamed protein product, partial [Staurois parvus]